jgi:uncharacterized protein (DUF2235 family)
MKRIVVCADGTWNEPERRDKKTGRIYPTNVLKVARAVLPQASGGVTQVVYYHKGVGTSGGLDKFTGGAFGDGIELNIRSLYRFIVLNYQPGDELYLFGFSRGAFTVRTLVGLMNCIGLLEKDDEYYLPELYGLYESSEPRNSEKWKHAFRNIDKVRPCPPIRFVGVWDTVGALGAPGVIGTLAKKVGLNKYKYHDVELNSQVQHAFHALAIDERRKAFLPTLWHRPAGWTGVLEQAWFAGVHSNVGGSYSPDGLANEALHWIVEKAESLGLEVDSKYLAHFWPCFNSVLNNSMKGFYKIMGSHVRPVAQSPTDGECLHQAAVDRKNLAACGYGPENLNKCLAAPSTTRVVNTTRVARGKPC